MRISLVDSLENTNTINISYIWVIILFPMIILSDVFI